jgi:hypothetical protein
MKPEVPFWQVNVALDTRPVVGVSMLGPSEINISRFGNDNRCAARSLTKSRPPKSPDKTFQTLVSRLEVIKPDLVSESLTDAVDLIVVSTLREREELCLKLREPKRVLREQYLTAFELSRLDRHAGDFVALRLDRNSREVSFFELLDESGAHSGIFDQDTMRLVYLCVRDHT